jgi:peptidoglycan/xylan/chitin deacetylase (PgdA/CDA1 family)
MRMAVLMYHMFGGSREGQMLRYACTERDFERQMAFLASKGYAAMALETACDFPGGMDLAPERVVAITTDDGAMDNYEIAVPILKRFGFSATFFVVPSFVGKTNEWMREDKGMLRRLMGWKEIREIADHGIRIGSHSVSHPDLTQVSDENLVREVGDSKRMIEDQLGLPVDSFAYPFGRFDERVKEAVARAGYAVACTTNSGFNGPGEDLHALRRIEVYGTDNMARFRRKLTFGVNDAPVSLSARYYASRLENRVVNLVTGLGR